MKTSHPYTFLTLLGISCCVWVSSHEPAIKAPLYQESKETHLAKNIKNIENQLVKKDMGDTVPISIEEGTFRFAAW